MKGKIAVFCSASDVIDPVYNKVARDFVRAASLCGYTIVSGGTVKGTMREIADELSSCGGRHVGVLPRFMEPLVYPKLTDVVVTETMAQRKALMREDTCACVALPGGIGTLDEFIETMTLRKLGQYGGRLFLLDVNGFYAPFIDLLNYYVRQGMLDEESKNIVEVFSDAEELVASLNGCEHGS